MAETGTVIAARDGVVDVRIEKTTACENCTACSVVEDDMVLRDVRDPLGAAVGDTVEVDFDPGARPLLLAVAYLTPVAGIAVGYALGAAAAAALGTDPDATGALCALAGAGAGLLAARSGLRRLGARSGMRPGLRAIIARGLVEAEGGPPPGGSRDDTGGTGQ